MRYFTSSFLAAAIFAAAPLAVCAVPVPAPGECSTGSTCRDFPGHTMTSAPVVPSQQPSNISILPTTTADAFANSSSLVPNPDPSPTQREFGGEASIHIGKTRTWSIGFKGSYSRS